ncbi:MAG: hypothetical protein AAB446_01775 [Patescibacteria group bacterium]
MTENIQKNNDFLNIYTKSHRLAAAVFMVSNIIEQNEGLKTKIKNLSLELVSLSVKLKDINFLDVKKLITDIEKNSLELMSMLDIACASDLVSKMNTGVIKSEFQSFIIELNKFVENFESNKNISVKGVFTESPILNMELSIGNNLEKINPVNTYTNHNGAYKNEQKSVPINSFKNGNGHKRKDLRKNTILDFIKGHNNVSIKDIASNITGCSEKTIQRELISLIEERKIKKTGERRWSKYSVL